MGYAERIVTFPVKIEGPEEKIEVRKIVPIPKLKKNGERKLTHNNKIAGKKTGNDTIYEYKEIQKMANYFTEHNMHIERAMFMTEFLTGRRIGDVRNLIWSDILYDDLRFKNEFTIIEEKTKKETTLIMPKQLKDELIQYQENYHVKLNMNKLNDNVFMQTSGRGKWKVMTTSAFNQHVKMVAKEVGVPGNITSHSIRRAFAWWLYKENENDPNCLKIVQKVMRHADLRTTERYLKFEERKFKEYLEKHGKTFEGIDDNTDEEFLINKSPIVRIGSNVLRDVLKQVYDDGVSGKEIWSALSKAQNIIEQKQ